MTPTDKPYCRGSNAIFRKLPNNGAECVIDFRDPSLLPSVLFHLNGEYHDSQMFIRENLDLLRAQIAAQSAQIEKLRTACEAVIHSDGVVRRYVAYRNEKIIAEWPIIVEACESALAATSRGEGQESAHGN